MLKTEKIFRNVVVVSFVAVLCNILWGSAFVFIKAGYEEFQIKERISEQLLFAGIRFFVSGLILFLIYMILYRNLPVLNKGNIKIVVSLAFFQTFFQYIFFYIGLSNTTAANGSIVNSMNVFTSAVLAHFIYKNDKMTFQKAVGCLIGFVGVLSVTIGKGSAQFSPTGEGFIMLAGCMFAVGSVFSKKASQKDNPIAVTAWNLTVGGLLLIFFGFLGGGRLVHVTTKGILMLWYLALLSAVAFTLWTILLKFNNIGKICIYNFVIPVSGVILSGFILKENIIQLKYMISLVLVTVGIYIVNLKKSV